MKKLALTLALTLTSCEYKPEIATDGVDMEMYKEDLKTCRQYEDFYDQKKNSLNSILYTSAAGASAGAYEGAAAANNVLLGTAVGGGVGGMLASIEGKYDQAEEREQVLRNCLADKGYEVTN